MLLFPNKIPLTKKIPRRIAYAPLSTIASALERELSANLADEEYTVKKAMLREGLDFSAKENMGIVARVLYCMPDAEEQSEEQSEEKVA